MSLPLASRSPGGDNFALLGLFLGDVGDNDAWGGSCLRFETFDHDSIVKRT
jgi:hypothetical protein